MIYCVEDERNIRELLVYTLETTGFEAEGFETGAELDTAMKKNMPELILLDIMLPGEDGYNILKRLKSDTRTRDIPVIMVTAKEAEFDKVKGLEGGADDYITKPFGTGELLARVRAALRVNRYGGGSLPGGVFSAQGLTINYERRKVFVDGQEVRLTQTEYNIVAFLSEHAGRVMTYAAIVKAIWGDTDIGSTKKLQVNMANIRKKLGSRPGSNNYILNELGVGYRMIDEDGDSKPLDLAVEER